MCSPSCNIGASSNDLPRARATHVRGNDGMAPASPFSATSGTTCSAIVAAATGAVQRERLDVCAASFILLVHLAHLIVLMPETNVVCAVKKPEAEDATVGHSE